jgi:hypothetical protein
MNLAEALQWVVTPSDYNGIQLPALVIGRRLSRKKMPDCRVAPDPQDAR